MLPPDAVVPDVALDTLTGGIQGVVAGVALAVVGTVRHDGRAAVYAACVVKPAVAEASDRTRHTSCAVLAVESRVAATVGDSHASPRGG